MKKKSICIDARFLGIRHTGIGRYVENLIKNLPENSKIEVHLIVHPENLKLDYLQKYYLHSASYHPYSIMSQVEMVKILTRIKPNLLHVPHFTVPIFWSGNIVVTIHDLIKHISTGSNTTTRHPYVYQLKMLGYKYTVRMAIKKSVHIITPTEYWKNQLVSIYKIPKEKITVTYEGVSL